MRRLRLFVFSLLIAGGLALGLHLPAIAVTNLSPTTSYCMPWNAFAGIYLPQWEPLLYVSAGCGPQYGDLFTDGPIFNPIVTITSGLTFTIPANTFVAQAQRVVTQAFPTTAPSNTTSYWWLDCNQCTGVTYGTWENTLSNTPPHSYSTLEYTVNTGVSAINTITPVYNIVQFASGNFTIGYGNQYNNTSNPFAVVFNSNVDQYYTSSAAETLVSGNVGFIWQNLATHFGSPICTNSANQYIAQFVNNDTPAQSIVRISCSDATTPGLPPPALYVNGIIQAAYGEFANIANSSLSGTGAICGSSSTVESTCSNAAVLASILTAPIPQATSTPLLITNSTGSISGSVAAWLLDETASGCSSIGLLASDEIFAVEDGSGQMFSVLCNGNTNADGILSAGSGSLPAAAAAGDIVALNGNVFYGAGASACKLSNSGGLGTTLISGCVGKFGGIFNTGLASATASPICAANNAVETQTCDVMPDTPVTSNNGTCSTGTSANTYVTCATLSVTTGVSNGPQGKFLVELEMFGSAGASGSTTETLSMCINSTGTYTLLNSSVQSNANVCTGNPANSVAGNVPFGEAANANSTFMLSEYVKAIVTMPNSTTTSFNCKGEGSTTTSATINYYCQAIKIPI